MRLHCEAGFNRLFCQQASGQQHAGVGGVGATGDCRDQYVAITHSDAVPPCRRRTVRSGLHITGLARMRQRGAVAFHLGDLPCCAHRRWRCGGQRVQPTFIGAAHQMPGIEHASGLIKTVFSN